MIMKRTLVILLAAIACMLGSNSCKRTVDYFYPTTFAYVNSTSHSIKVAIKSSFTPMEFTLAPGGSYSKLWDIGHGPTPFDITEAEIEFDGEYKIVHNYTWTEEESIYHNICDSDNYVSSPDPEHKHGEIYTFTFTEDDYDYAVAASGK